MLRILAVRGERELLTDLGAAALPGLLADPEVRIWVELAGPMDEDALAVVRDVFHFHPLTIKDCFESRENPKAEAFDDYVYVITHGLTAGSTAEETEIVELDAFLGGRFLVTYHALPSRSVDGVLELVQRGSGAPLRRGPAYVLSLLLDRQVDGIEPVLETIEERIDELEERVVARPTNRDLAMLLALKRTVLKTRRWMTKQRDVVLRLARSEFPGIGKADAILFRDIFEHLQQFADSLENFREMLASLQGTYLNMTNLRLSEIMKFLTVFTAVLMPLTVITGIYGMNFDHMPELRSRWGYPAALGAMVVTAAIILFVFKRRGWLDRERGPR
jgi:magnesium transporter